MGGFIDYYKILGVHYEAGHDIINAAYRCFSKMYHPDINGNPAANEKMKMINIAYSAIGSPKKRRLYHKEWVKNNCGAGGSHIEQPSEDMSREEEAALAVLENFFDDLIKEQWRKSYHRLTATDRRNIPIEEYIEWKKAVSKLYKLGNYKIDYFCTYDNCEYAGVNYPIVHHFSVGLTEMEIAGGKVNQEQTQKYIALDEGEWRVCLGYSDLKPSIRRFKYLAKILPIIDRDEIIEKALNSIDPLTGIYSRKGFLEEGGRELKRVERYGNPLSLGVMEIRPADPGSVTFKKERDMIITYISEALSGNIRKTDIMGRCKETAFAVLFTETEAEKAEFTVQRLLDTIERDGPSDCEYLWAVKELKGGNMETQLDKALSEAVVKEKTSEGTGKKLGKYHLSDILEFNKKGRNHF